MLTLDRPISLVVREGAPLLPVSFGERIRSNYEITAAAFSPEELLFLLVNPPETPYEEGDFIHIAVGGARRDTQNFILSVVNNVVNRVLLSDNGAPVYQDTVYIDMALRKLGVENVALFMEQVRVLREENLNAQSLTELYGNNMRILRETLARETELRGKTVKTTEAKDETQARDRALYLHSEIYRRLDTAAIVRALARFAREASESRTRVDAREMRIAEMRRAVTVLALNEYRREIPAFGAGDVYYNRNLYETGDVLETPKDEKSVLRQALTAALLQIADNVTTSRGADRPAEGREVWLDVAEALRASARSSAERFLSFRESAALTGARREPADLRTLALLTRSEGEILSRHLEEFRAYKEGRDARITAPNADADSSADARDARADTDAERGARAFARETLLELARIYSARLRASETPARRIRARVTEETRAAGPLPKAATLGAEADGERARPATDGPPLTHATREAAAAAAKEDARETVAPRAFDTGSGAPDRQRGPSEDGAPERDAARAFETRITSVLATARETASRTESERETILLARETAARGESGTAGGGETGEARAGGDRGADAPAGESPAAAEAGAEERPAPRAGEAFAEEDRAAPLPPGFAFYGAGAEAERALPADGAAPLLTHAAREPSDVSEDIAREATGQPGGIASREAALGTDLSAADGAARALARAMDASYAYARATEQAEILFAERGPAAVPTAREATAREKTERFDGGETGEAKTGGIGGEDAPTGERPATALTRIVEAAPYARVTERAEILFAERGLGAVPAVREATARAERTAAPPEGAAQGGESGADGAAQGETTLRETLDRIDRENKERLEYLRELRPALPENAAPPRPDRRRIMRDALRAIENPEQVLSEALERESAAPRAAADAWEEPLVYADESSKEVLELLRLLQKDPAAAAAAGVTVARGPEALMEDIAAVEKERAERAAVAETERDRVAFRESTERLIERQITLSAAPPPSPGTFGGTAWNTATPIVHRRPAAAPDLDAILQQRDRRVTEERSRRDEKTETTVRVNEIRTQDERIARDAAAKSAEDIAEMINTTLMRQMGTIADRVYGHLEKKLKSEKSRRGRI
jgi:hypothetical protein